MKKLISFLVVFCAISSTVFAEDSVTFNGPWRTISPIKLDGNMTAVVTPKGNQQWTARFYGIWQGSKYDYNVNFTGPANNLTGQATIDGARYNWTGSVTQKTFTGKFTGSRYTGDFNMRN